MKTRAPYRAAGIPGRINPVPTKPRKVRSRAPILRKGK